LQANEVGSSNKMELEGAKWSFSIIKDIEKLPIKTFVSDRHRGIGKWMRTTQKDTTHYYDIWHQAKSTVKKVLKASKEKGCEILAEWTKSIRNHLYWCATSSRAGFSSLIEAKWLSFMRHVNNEHDGHPNALYEKCHHAEITEAKKLIKVG
jgi:solute carrier family 8 (sodium/calcium exchanger)